MENLFSLFIIIIERSLQVLGKTGKTGVDDGLHMQRRKVTISLSSEMRLSLLCLRRSFTLSCERHWCARKSCKWACDCIPMPGYIQENLR